MPDRTSRRRRRTAPPSDETPSTAADIGEGAAPSAPLAPSRPIEDEDLVPRPSKMRYVAIFFAGLLVGRIASSNFAPGALDAVDLFMVIGLAFSLAWAWRSWAKRAMIQRHLAAERRRQRSGGSTTTRPKKR